MEDVDQSGEKRAGQRGGFFNGRGRTPWDNQSDNNDMNHDKLPQRSTAAKTAVLVLIQM